MSGVLAKTVSRRRTSLTRGREDRCVCRQQTLSALSGESSTTNPMALPFSGSFDIEQLLRVPGPIFDCQKMLSEDT